MLVKKGWYGLLKVLMLLFLTGCAHRIATKSDPPKEETTTQNPSIEQSSKKSTNGWVLTEQPHPKVLEMYEGFGIHQDRFKFYFDTLSGVIDKNEAVRIAKYLLNCPPEDDFIYFAEDYFLNKKSIKNGKNAKFGKWQHKGMEVNDYRFNFRAIDKGKLTNRLYVKYNKEFDVDLSSLMSIDSAMNIVKAKAIPDFFKEEFCWDAPYNQSCSPKISLIIFPHIRNYKMQYHTTHYIICISKSNNAAHCNTGISVNAQTGETMGTASVARVSYLKNKTIPTKTEVTEINTINKNQKRKTVTKENKLEYGTYFTKISLEYAWLDTVKFDDLVEQKWIEYTEYEQNKNKNTKQNLNLISGYFNKTFSDMLPEIPLDSFMMYTAHWYDVDSNFTFASKDSGTKYYNARYYQQNYIGVKVRNHYVRVKFDLQDAKPTYFQLFLARNLDLELTNKPFPFDSLYVLASDSLRMPNGNKYDEFYYNAFENMDDPFNYNPLEYPLKEKYRKKYIHFDGNVFRHATEISIYGNNKLYQFMFDMRTKKLLSAINTINY